MQLCVPGIVFKRKSNTLSTRILILFSLYVHRECSGIVHINNSIVTIVICSCNRAVQKWYLWILCDITLDE